MGGIYLVGRAPRRRQQEALDEAMHHASEQAPAVNVVQPEKGATITSLALPAEAHAFFETTIFARTSGYLNRWLVDIGDRVKSGQLLAVIETPELEEQLIEARAKVTALEADVRLTEAQARFARITSDRWDAAAPDGAVSQQERDEKKAQLDNARARLDAAQAQLELGKATVKRLEFETNFQKVVAPFDGVITSRHVDVGSLVTAGSTASTTPLFSIAQYDRVRVLVQVPQTASPDITIGMKANITAREFPERVFSGDVERTSGAIDPVSRTLKVEVVAANPSLTLLPGMFLTVSFQIVRPEAPLIVQAGSINLRKAGPQVAVIDSGHHVHFRNVEVARDLGDTVEIARGLSSDEWVALNISDEIAEGDAVQPVPLGSKSSKLATPSTPPRPREQSHESKTIAAAEKPVRSP
jgi:RND family efflux transporter MFP subunit